MRTRIAPPALLALLVAACAEAPPPPPRPVHLEPPPPPAPVPLAAHWVTTGGATAVGPQLAAGTLVLTGGRRGLVKPDGTLENEREPAPEPLLEIVEIPSAGGVKLVARGTHELYRFDDPLGAPVTLCRSDRMLLRLGAGPGVVAVWTAGSEVPRFLDVATGRETALPGLPDPPLRALSFVDAKRGAGVFEAVGLAVTTDGGASWHRAAETGRGDALRAGGLRAQAGSVRAFTYAEGPDGAVDLDGARLGAMEPPRSPASEPPLLRWIRATHRDPLEVAATSGIDPQTGPAVIASHGFLARVNARTGGMPELFELAKGKQMGGCATGRAGQSAWIACALADDAAKDFYDPFGVMRVPLGDGPLTPDKPELVRNGDAELRVSPSGGAMLMGACSANDNGNACVRQPSGKWQTVSLNVDLLEHGAGPLADGRVAYLRAMSDGDEDPELASLAGKADDELAKRRRLHVAVAGTDGKERLLASLAFTPSRGFVRVQSPIEEDADHTLHFVIEDGEGPYTLAGAPGRDAIPSNRISDAVAARLHAGRGIAVGDGRVLASLDGGLTWNDVPATPPVLEEAGRVSGAYEDASELAVSEVGAKVGSMLRLGWGPSDPAPAPPSGAEPPQPPILAAPQAVQPGPEAPFSCTSQGNAQGASVILNNEQVRKLLTGFEPGKAPPIPGVRRDVGVWIAGRGGMLDAFGLVEQDGPEGKAPVKLTFRWFDPQEIGAKPRSATVPLPKSAPWGVGLRHVAASGARAFFAVRFGGKHQLVRVKGAGAHEMAEIPADLLPTGEVVFGADKGEPIVWTHESAVVAWLAGERPRVIAHLAPHATKHLGVPTAAGVPLLLGAADWSILRVLPIPAAGKGAADHPPPPAPPSLDGWTRLPPLFPRLASLPACGPRAAGVRFSIPRVTLHADIDGEAEAGNQVVYDVRVNGSEACIAGLTATLGPDRRVRPTPAGVTVKPSRSAGLSSNAFVRADFVGKRAEGGDRGLTPAKRLTCTLGATAAPKKP